MPEILTVFEKAIDFDPGADFEAFLRAAPAKWVVYLLADVDDRPVQLLCVKNLRASLKRRLGPEESPLLTRRVDYREIVRRVHWRRVSSAFEADWIYYEAARRLFPESYQGMVGFRRAWFVHVNPDARFPRYTKTINLTPRAGQFIGPLEDKHAAARLTHLAEDAFDLCRYYNILVEAPHANACAYKGMGKCPAPCDGSISMEQYRRMIEWSAETIVQPGPMIEDQTRRMQQAAAALRFESAGKIKQFVEVLGQFGKGAFRHARRLEDFAYIVLQHGPREGSAKIFLVTAGRIDHVLSLIDEPAKPAEMLRHMLATAADRRTDPLDEVGAERISIVAVHLFTSKQIHGVFIPLATIDEKSLAKAWRDLKKQKQAGEVEGEGVVKELENLGGFTPAPLPEAADEPDDAGQP